MSQRIPYKVFVHLSEARSFLGLSDNQTSDAYAVIRIGPCSGLSRKTEVKFETVNAVWEAKFLFEDVMLTNEEFKREKLSISVYDRNVFAKNELIGSHEFSLTNIVRQKSGQYDRKWFALTLPEQPGHNRGFMKLTAFVLRPGAETPHPEEDVDKEDGDEDRTILGDPLLEQRAPYVLNILIYRGQHILENTQLPIGGSRNPFVTVRFNGNVARTPSCFNATAPVWNVKLVLPFNMPLTSESIEVQLWNSVNHRPSQLIGEETFNYFNLGLTHKAWGPRWVNMYSSEYASNQVSMLGGIKDRLDVSGRNNPLRSEYVGRLLVRMSVTPTDRTNQRLLVLNCNPVSAPPTVEYCLDLLLYSSLEVPVMGGQVKVEVVFGDKRAESTRKLGKDGVFTWMETMTPVHGKHDKIPDAEDPMRLSLRIHGPADVEQLHDVIISVFHCVGNSTRKIGFLRLKPVQMLPLARLDTYFVNGQYAIPKKGLISQRALQDMWAPRWYTLNHVRPDPDNPQLVAGFLLMSIGFGMSAVRPAAVPRPIKRPSVKCTLRCYLYHGANLLTADSNATTTNPFLVVRFADASYRTRTISGTTFPFWCEYADLGPVAVDHENPPTIFLQLYHQTQLQYKLIGRTDVLGKHALANTGGAVHRYLLYYDPHEAQDDEAHGSAIDATGGVAGDIAGGHGRSGPGSAGSSLTPAGSALTSSRPSGDPEKCPYVLACFQLLPYIPERRRRVAKYPIKKDWLPQLGENVDGIEVTGGTDAAGHRGATAHGRRPRRRHALDAMASSRKAAAAAAGGDAAGDGGNGGDDEAPFLLRGPFGVRDSDSDDGDDSTTSDSDDGAAAAGETGETGDTEATLARRARRSRRRAAAEEEEEELLNARRGNQHTFTGENPEHVWWRPQTAEFACKLEMVGARHLKNWQLTEDSKLRVEVAIPQVAGLAKSWKHSVPAAQKWVTYERTATATLDGTAVQLMESQALNSVRIPLVNPNGVCMRVSVFDSRVGGEVLLGVSHVHLFQNNLVSIPNADVPHFYQYKGYYDRRIIMDRDNQLADRSGAEDETTDGGRSASTTAAGGGSDARSGASLSSGSDYSSSDGSSDDDDDDDDDEGDDGVGDNGNDDGEGSADGDVEGRARGSKGPYLPDDDDAVARELADLGITVKPRSTRKSRRRNRRAEAAAAAAAAGTGNGRARSEDGGDDDGGGSDGSDASDDGPGASGGRRRRAKYRGQFDEFGNPVIELENGQDQANTFAEAATSGTAHANKLLIQGFLQNHNASRLLSGGGAGSGTGSSSVAMAASGGAVATAAAHLHPEEEEEIDRFSAPLSVPLMAGRQVGFSHVQSTLLQVSDSVQWRQVGVMRFYFTSRTIPDLKAPPPSVRAANDDALEEWRAQCQEVRKRVLQEVRDVDNLGWLTDRVFNQRFISRLYVYEGKYLSPRESFFTGNQSANPFLVVSNASGPDFTVNNRETARENNINPEFYQVFEMPTELPKNHMLQVSVWNRDNIVGDELIGTISIDVEELVLSRRTFGSSAYYSLFTEQSVLSHGKLKMKLDVLTDAEARRVRAEDLVAQDPTEFELRMVIWNTRDVRMPEEKDKDKDVDQKIFATANFEGEYGNDIIKDTDTAWYSSSGMAEWNWRMKWRLRLPCQVPRIKLSMWSDNVMSESIAIGECNYSLQPFFEQSLRDRKPVSHRAQQWVPLTHPNFPDVMLGEVCIEFWLLTAIEADKAPVGEAQSEPNQDPFLPNPHRNPPPWAVGTRGLTWLAKRKALLICICLIVVIVPILVPVIVLQTKK